MIFFSYNYKTQNRKVVYWKAETLGNYGIKQCVHVQRGSYELWMYHHNHYIFHYFSYSLFFFHPESSLTLYIYTLLWQIYCSIWLNYDAYYIIVLYLIIGFHNSHYPLYDRHRQNNWFWMTFDWNSFKH